MPPAGAAASAAARDHQSVFRRAGSAAGNNAPEASLHERHTQAPGDPIGTPQNYYLIAYKNHAVYTALAYWVEDKTLHYVTTQNTHNQASLDLIDLTLTKSLNQRERRAILDSGPVKAVRNGASPSRKS